ncbi:N-acetylmuramoyl-L-alanine amidase [Clostridium sp.]|uniref:N-acetylmuramoyl-L-alanine amidase n=1 Tax=Clostridium sp. TaxID=1506 RepID=UPI003F2CF602
MYKFSYRDTYGKNLSDEKIDELRDNLNIKDIVYDWGEELVYNNKPKEIIYHHSASSEWSPEEIHDFHKEKGWSGIGYQFYIRKDGTIYRGRPEKAEGAHTKGKNKESIGICLEGNFEEERLSIEQVESLYELSVYISLKYDIGDIVGHREEGSTLCPGENFPVKSLRDKVIKEIEKFDVEKNKITHLLE